MVVRELLAEALRIVNIGDFASTTVPATGYLQHALFYLNLALEMNREFIPYTNETIVTGTAGLAALNPSEVIDVKFYLTPSATSDGAVAYPLQRADRVSFENTRLLPQLKAIPYEYYFEKSTGIIRVWPLPFDESWPFEVSFYGNFKFATIEDEVPASFRGGLKMFMIYETAYYLSDQFGAGLWSGAKESKRRMFKRQLINTNAEKIMPTPNLDELMIGKNQQVPWLSYLAGDFPGGFGR